MICQFCKHAQARWSCTRCHSAFYCSRRCQILDWRRHESADCELSGAVVMVGSGKTDKIWGGIAGRQDFLERLRGDDSVPRDGINFDKVKTMFMDADPSKNKGEYYTKWIFDGYAAGCNGPMSNLENVYSALERYMELVTHKILDVSDRDIFKWKGLYPCADSPGLGELLAKYKDYESNKDKIKKGLTVVYEDSLVVVYNVTNKDAAIKIGKNTKWCTATTKGDNMFDTYIADGPIYVIVPRVARRFRADPHNPSNQMPCEKYQINFQSAQAMNEENTEMSADDYERYKVSIAGFLTQIKFDPNGTTRDGQTTLLDVARSTPVLMRLLLEVSADPTRRYENGFTLLHVIVAEVKSTADMDANTDKILDFLLKKPASVIMSSPSSSSLRIAPRIDVEARDAKGRSAMFYAKTEALMRELQERGANVNAQDSTGRTPLFEAVLVGIRDLRYGNRSIVYSFLNIGANPTIANNQGMMPFEIPDLGDKVFNILVKRIKAGDMNRTYPNRTTFLQHQINKKRASPDRVAYMLEHGADPNLLDPYNSETPLTSAAKYDDGTAAIEFVKVLLAHGANPMGRNRKDNKTPAEIATTLGRKEIYLLCAEALTSQITNT